jgi:hypothetical protein
MNKRCSIDMSLLDLIRMYHLILKNISAIVYAALNLFIIFVVNKLSDLPVWVGNWESKSNLLVSFKLPIDNFYPPGGAILLSPFLRFGPNYEIVVYFYFTISSIVYYAICKKIIHNKMFFYLALSGLTFNPYLLWLVNSSQDTVFELFLLLAGFALLISRRFILSFFPLYLLCLTRPAYWPGFLIIPMVVYFLKLKNNKEVPTSKKKASIPLVMLLTTILINQFSFGNPSLAGEAGVTAHFGHNKNWYLAMPKFDSDVFLAKGGNMDATKVLQNSDKFKNVKDLELRAALVSIYENPKSLALNTLQKIDTYFFAFQKNPQLSGEYYLSEDQKSIVIGPNRDSWVLIFGSFAYFLYRAMLFISIIVALTLLATTPGLRKKVMAQPLVLFCVPYLMGSIAAILFFTEARYKIVSELLLSLMIVSIFDKYLYLNKIDVHRQVTNHK